MPRRSFTFDTETFSFDCPDMGKKGGCTRDGCPKPVVDREHCTPPGGDLVAFFKSELTAMGHRVGGEDWEYGAWTFEVSENGEAHAISIWARPARTRGETVRNPFTLGTMNMPACAAGWDCQVERRQPPPPPLGKRIRSWWTRETTPREVLLVTTDAKDAIEQVLRRAEHTSAVEWDTAPESNTPTLF